MKILALSYSAFVYSLQCNCYCPRGPATKCSGNLVFALDRDPVTSPIWSKFLTQIKILLKSIERDEFLEFGGGADQVKLAFKKYPPDDFPELNLHDYENQSILSASSRDLRNYIGHQISYSQPAEFSPNITQLIRDVENEDSEKMLTLFFSNGHWNLQRLNYEIKSKIVPITAIPPCAGFKICPEMRRLRTLSNLPKEKVFHFGLSSKDDIKQLIVERLCEKAANDCECDCPDSQFSNLFPPTNPPSTTPSFSNEDLMSSEDIKQLVRETVQEALANEKKIEIKEEYPISSNLALGRPSLFHSYGVSEIMENSVVTDGNTCYEQSCCALTEYIYEPWWMIDLGASKRVSQINIRSPLLKEIYGAEIRLGSSKRFLDNPTVGYVSSSPYQRLSRTESGQYLTLFLPRTHAQMKICEIEIFSSWRFDPDEKEPSLSFNFEDESQYDAVSDGSGEDILITL